MNAANLARDRRSTRTRVQRSQQGRHLGPDAAARGEHGAPPVREAPRRRGPRADRHRKADEAELDKPAKDARIAAKKARGDKKAADHQEIIDLARATCWADIVELPTAELLKQIKVYQVVEGNTSIVISRDASSRSARMLFLAQS